MKVLVACEESQRVCIAFRNKGHEAYSCDIIDCSGGHPEWHIKDDVLKHLEGWDLIIAHPPCTYLTRAGAPVLKKHPERFEMGVEATEFFMRLYNAPCSKICVENPIPMRLFNLPKYSQIIHPYEFGDLACKPTCLWLKGLAPLKPTKILDKSLIPMRRWVNSKGKKNSCSLWYDKGGSKHRSKTFQGIADAMAEQWG